MTAADERAAQEKLHGTLLKMRERIEPFLPADVTFDAVVSGALLSALQTPALYGCSGKSLLIALVQAVQTGLTIGRSVFLVPFKGTATMVVHYRGYVELALATGKVRNVFAHVVREGEPFEVYAGTEPRIVHRITFESEARPIVGAYAVATFPNGGVVTEVMSKAAVERIRREYSQKWGGGELPPWYARKTPVRQLAKYLPMTRGLYLAQRYEAQPDLVLTPEQVEADLASGASAALLSGPEEEAAGGDLAPAGVPAGRVKAAVRLVLPPDARVAPLEDPARHGLIPPPVPSVADLTAVEPVGIPRPSAPAHPNPLMPPGPSRRPARPAPSTAPAAWSAPVQSGPLPDPLAALEEDPDGLPF